MSRKAIIFGIKGKKLTSHEKNFFLKSKPWGLIIFSRNVKNLKQLKKLIDEIKSIMKDKKYPILIDQEGGRVSRLNKIIDFQIFSQDFFAKLYKHNNKNFINTYKVYINTVSNILKNVGININTVPVLDVKTNNGNNIIGDRAFSSDPNLVAKLGNICIDFYSKNKIATVIKHIPGHGKAKFDSHHKVSIIKSEKNKLIKEDFKPFKQSQSFFAMTAHLIYKKYDGKNTATHSKIVINNLIRKHIGFKGILISDDISMKALKFSLNENATKALEAGCNLVLHCNGNIKEMVMLSKVIPFIDKFTQKKTSDFYDFLG